MSVRNARPRYVVVRLAAPSDANGNPRRVYVVNDVEGKIPPRAYDEGYQGRGAVPAEVWDDAAVLGTIPVAVKVYREALRAG